MGNGCWVLDFIVDTRLCVVGKVICWRMCIGCWRSSTDGIKLTCSKLGWLNIEVCAAVVAVELRRRSSVTHGRIIKKITVDLFCSLWLILPSGIISVDS